MSKDDKPLFDLRNEYVSLTDKAFQFTLLRIPILLTIILVLYNGITDNQFAKVTKNYNDVDTLYDASWRVPYIHDWYVDHMFDNHGILEPNVMDRYQTIYYEESHVNERFPEADTIFTFVPAFFSDYNPDSNYTSNRQSIDYWFRHLLGRVAPSRRISLNYWYKDFLNEFQKEKSEDSLLWINAKNNPLSKKYKDTVYAIHSEMVTDAKFNSQISGVIPIDIPYKGKLYTLLARPDTEEMNAAARKQTEDLNEIKKTLGSAFTLKLSILGDAPLNLQYWIFVLPSLMVLSFMYLLILRAKIGVIEILSKDLNKDDSPFGLLHGKGITTFHRQPYKTFTTLFDFIEVFLWVIAVYIFVFTVRNFHGFVGDTMKCSLIAIYFSLIYCSHIIYTLRCRCLENPKPVIIMCIWQAFFRFLSYVFSYRQRKIYLTLGNVIIMYSLIAIMCSRGCHPEVPPNTQFTTLDSKKISENDLASKAGINRKETGLLLILGYKQFIWDNAKGGELPNRFFQICYVITIATVFCYLLLLTMRSLWSPIVFFRIRRLIFVIMGLILLEFSIYMSRPFTDLGLTVVFILVLCSIWLYTNKSSIFFSPANSNIKSLSETLLLFALPFLVMTVIVNYDSYAYFVLAFLFGEYKIYFFLGLLLFVLGILLTLQFEKQKLALTATSLDSPLTTQPRFHFSTFVISIRRWRNMVKPTGSYAFLIYVSYIIVGKIINVERVEYSFSLNSIFFDLPIGILNGVFMCLVDLPLFLVFWSAISWVISKSSKKVWQKIYVFLSGLAFTGLRVMLYLILSNPKEEFYKSDRSKMFEDCIVYVIVLLIAVCIYPIPKSPSKDLTKESNV